MMYWIYDYPNWAIMALFVAVFLGVTWVGIFVTRATIHSWIHTETRANEMVNSALSSFFVLFGLLLGLVAVIFLIAALDNPFRGEVSIGPDSIALVYDTLMKPGVTTKQPGPK